MDVVLARSSDALYQKQIVLFTIDKMTLLYDIFCGIGIATVAVFVLLITLIVVVSVRADAPSE